MCGIVGYIGKKQVTPILMDGLNKLEYRGYDSAGIAVVDNEKVHCQKRVGKVINLTQALKKNNIFGQIGIAHTRWATHGKPTEINAHPHFDCRKEIFVVHNGIIENYLELKKQLEKKGHKFVSETDTEVIAHLIEEHYHRNTGTQEHRNKKTGRLENAIRQSLKKVIGAYGLAIISTREPDKIIVARNGSPLLIGVAKNEYLVASDAAAILTYTKKVIYLNDGEMAVVSKNKIKITNMRDKAITKKISTITWSEEQISKAGYPHFMLKEMMEQPESLLNSIRGRTIASRGQVKLGGLENVADKIRNAQKISIVACGTARLAGLVGEYMLEEYAKIPTEVDYAHEFRYRQPILDNKSVLLAISQSGETADTLAAVREAKKQGALALGIVNVVGSTISRETDAGVYNHSGPEIAVASTKAFTSQLAIMALLTVLLGRERQMPLGTAKSIIKGLIQIPDKIKEILATDKEIFQIAKKYHHYKNFAFLGRKYNHPTALEGAIKLKELTYIHAEGFAGGEMKHGPIAMIDKDFPSIFIIPRDSVYEKNFNGIEEIRARGGKVMAIATRGDKEIAKLVDDVIYIPRSLEMLTPILAIIPLQLFAYHMAVLNGRDVDKPRNLAKSVTVE